MNGYKELYEQYEILGYSSEEEANNEQSCFLQMFRNLEEEELQNINIMDNAKLSVKIDNAKLINK